MKRTSALPRTVALAAIGAIVLAGCTSNSPDGAPAPSAASSSAATRGVAGQVAALLAEAKEAFDSPTRTSTAGNTDKTVDNMAVVEQKLLAASALAPYRADLLFSAASARIAQKNVPGALELYRKVLDVAPDDDDAHTYLAVWNRFLGDAAGSAAEVEQLRRVAPDRVPEVEALFTAIDRAVGATLTDSPPRIAPPATGIVVLGYALKKDGSMDAPLIQRLEKTLEVARALPAAPIVVTGGVEQAGNTEGALMKTWLVERGVDAARITDENFARTTVENALYSSYVLATQRIEHAIVVSSASHVRRGTVDLILAARENLPATFAVSSVAAVDKPLAELATPSTDEMRSIYRDALSTLGLWSYRSAPLLQR
ncbi:ElyC/SanA/YdcF family protein [Tsukamurella paurometabola]|uniref:YdcF family protein n=1 Tax=Tsukamurella paurometabola TaxID=2061 RepID=A0ABS5N873_TSUPA|nr:ElyC/SanA/YdcF family protein [Tsukamurella paurometabola]MBS4100122.1 YdcF family protein [Tsukamurella paurometabola]